MQVFLGSVVFLTTLLSFPKQSVKVNMTKLSTQCTKL